MANPFILDGKKLAIQIEEELKQDIKNIIAKSDHTPVLATILVGNDPASATYVKIKDNARKRAGIESLRIELPEETTTEQLLNKIEFLNKVTLISESVQAAKKNLVYTER